MILSMVDSSYYTGANLGYYSMIARGFVLLGYSARHVFVRRRANYTMLKNYLGVPEAEVNIFLSDYLLPRTDLEYLDSEGK